MRILKARLKNLKSFGEDGPEISFADGVNFLSGVNGAGKSTIIEAIGFVLFDVLPYTQQDFLRRGTKSGTATVWIEENGEIFRVERRLGTTDSWVVYDSGDVGLYEKKPDVLKFLFAVFHVADSTQLENVFRNIVGVSQGMFTAVFKMTPVNRRKIFDGIINVDQYRKSADMHGAVKNRILDVQVGQIESEIVIARAFIEEHKEDPIKLTGTEEKLKVLDAQIRRLSEEKASLQTRKKTMDDTKAILDGLDREIARVDAIHNESRRVLSAAKNEVLRSQEASKVCRQTEPDHKAYLDAEKKQGQLELQRKERDRLQKRFQELDRTIHGQRTSINGLEATLSKNRKDESIQANEVLTRAEARTMRDAEAREAEAQAARAKADYDEFQRKVDGWCKAEESFLERLNKAKAAADVVREGIAEVQRLDQSLRDFSEVEKVAATADSTRSKENLLSTNRAKKDSEIHEHENNRKELANQVCPFIKERCDRVMPSVFLERIGAAKAELTRIDNDLVEIRNVVKIAADAEKRLEGLREKKNQIADQRRILLREWNKARKLLTEWTPILGKYPEFPEATEGEINLDSFDRYREDLASAINRLESDLKEKSNVDKSASREAAGARSAEVAANKELEALRQSLNRLRADLAANEGMLAKVLQALSEAESQKESVGSELLPFQTLEGAIVEAKERLEAHRKGHDLHVQHLRAAAELAMRENVVRETEVVLQQTKARVLELSNDRIKFAEQYDGTLAKKISDDLQVVASMLGSAETDLRVQDGLRSDLARSVAALRDRQSSLERSLMERSRLERFRGILADIWEILRVLGPRISERLLAGISARANRIFGLLHDQAGQLVWGRDYEVRLRQGNSDLPFGNLSGGEQMSAALSVQMAMARFFASSSFCIFDEPTTHLDEGRRERLATAIRDAQLDAGFTQVFVVSHDDTFGPFVDHQVKLQKDAKKGSAVVS